MQHLNTEAIDFWHASAILSAALVCPTVSKERGSDSPLTNTLVELIDTLGGRVRLSPPLDYHSTLSKERGSDNEYQHTISPL